MLKIRLILSYQLLSDIPADHLPIGAIGNSCVELDPIKIEALNKVVENFNSSGDELLINVFSNLYEEQEFSFNLIYTSGIAAPYDAWTVSIDNQPILFFNLSEWTVEELFSQGQAVIIHEVTHALLAPFLKNFEIKNHLDQLDRTIFDEGLAHFLGFPGDRFSLLERYQEKWTHSEIALQNAIESLRSIDVSKDEKDELLKKSNTGPYWDKYGAICGMFRFAKVYSTLGANGLTKAIKSLNIPYC